MKTMAKPVKNHQYFIYIIILSHYSSCNKVALAISSRVSTFPFSTVESFSSVSGALDIAILWIFSSNLAIIGILVVISVSCDSSSLKFKTVEAVLL
mmetsp:Transcript_11936/g.16411  ORF Transcript_11936/g.16411 Transcript_11936/m.16411 type:complete len:96 (-) Transcript_11936:91-378(-)